MASDGTEVQAKLPKGTQNWIKEIKALIKRHYEDGDLSKQAPTIKDLVLIRKEGESSKEISPDNWKKIVQTF